MRHWVKGPGKTISVPAKVAYGKTMNKARSYFENCILHIDGFLQINGKETTHVYKKDEHYTSYIFLDELFRCSRTITDSTKYVNKGKHYLEPHEVQKSRMNATYNKYCTNMPNQINQNREDWSCHNKQKSKYC